MPAHSGPTSTPPGRRLLLRARVVLPVAGPPLSNGALWIDGPDLAAVGAWKELRHVPRDEFQDLGEVIVLPGLVNAHCHLDYTDLAGHLPPPKQFPDWIKGLLALKAQWSYSDYALSWINGARMLLRHGVTTVGNIESVPEMLPEVRSTTPLRVCSLLEMTGVRSRLPPSAILEGALARIRALPQSSDWAGLSPHAPYSTSPELIQLAAEAARLQHWPLAIHVAESAEEFEMYTQARGPLFDWLQPQRNMSDCGHGSPVVHLHRHGGLADNLLAIHANYLAAGDAQLLAAHGCTVVHCPRSHAYFGHRPFPRPELAAAGVNVCLGTDSLASVRLMGRGRPELDLFAEMRALWQVEPGLSAEALVRFVTVNGARGMGLARRIGELSPGAAADWVSLPFSGRLRGAYEAVVEHRGPAAAVMINGRWVHPP